MVVNNFIALKNKLKHVRRPLTRVCKMTKVVTLACTNRVTL